ncbi:hypothetical protein PENNAL_c0626G05799, partial [Penicillium nalgiovense]
RAEVVTRPLLGGGASVGRLRATPRTDGGDRLPRGGGSVGPAVPYSLEPQAVAMDVDDPQESSDAECAASTSELGGEAMILEEDGGPPADRHSVPTVDAGAAASNAAVPGVHVGNGSLSEAARSSIDIIEEDTVRNIIRKAALAAASATDWLPRM